MEQLDFSKKLRKEMTASERQLWKRLRCRQVEGLYFRRQCPIGPYIVDFVCLEKMLVVEIDGSQHMSQQDADQSRTEWLQRHGFRVLRFWNNEVLRELDAVLESIRSSLLI